MYNLSQGEGVCIRVYYFKSIQDDYGYKGDTVMKIGVIGLGYWGPNLVRNFMATEGVDGVVGCDVLDTRLAKIKGAFHEVEVCRSFDDVLKRSDVDAIVLATPVSTHFPLGMRALEAGKHLLVEKPLTSYTADAEALLERAEQNHLVLMVDHTFLYTSAVRKIKELYDEGEIGEVLYFDSVRVNLGIFQRDTNVIWDLAPHDISIMDYIIGLKPLSVSAVGVNHFNGHEDIAYINVSFPNRVIAHFHLNWLSPVKIRRILIGGTKRMVVYDDMEPSEKLKLYDKGVQIKGKEWEYKALVEYRIGDMYAPRIEQTEALSLMVKDFVGAVLTGAQPVSSAQSGLNVVRILEAAEYSLRAEGQIVNLSGDGKRVSTSTPALVRTFRSHPTEWLKK